MRAGSRKEPTQQVGSLGAGGWGAGRGRRASLLPRAHPTATTAPTNQSQTPVALPAHHAFQPGSHVWLGPPLAFQQLRKANDPNYDGGNSPYQDLYPDPGKAP